MHDYIYAQRAILDSVDALRLWEFDWDGAAGLPIRDDAAEAVEALFLFSSTLGKPLLMELPEPEVSMESSGTVNVSFEDGKTGRKLFLTFECRGTITYLQVLEDDQTTVEGVIRIDVDLLPPADLVEITQLLNWLISE